MDDKSIVKTTSALNGHGIAWDDPTKTLPWHHDFYKSFGKKWPQDIKSVLYISSNIL